MAKVFTVHLWHSQLHLLQCPTAEKMGGKMGGRREWNRGRVAGREGGCGGDEVGGRRGQLGINVQV